MGTLTLSGVLKRPISGDVVPNARITFDAIATGNVVLKGVSSACKTASDGSYSVDLEYGDYAIQVSWSGQTLQYGSVHIDDTTPVGSLNDLLLQEVMESQLTPDIVLEFRKLEQEMQEDLAQMTSMNDQASGSATSAADSAAAAKMSEKNSEASEDAAEASEINAKNARDAAEKYAQEAKDASSKVTAPLTDQGQWIIQAGYPATPGVASIWQITDGGVDPINSEIIWNPGDMLIYLATSGTWCRLLGQQAVAGEPVPIKIDADIILNVGSGLQIVTSGTIAVDVARLDSDNNLILGDGAMPGVCFKTAAPTNLFVLVSDGNGGYTKSRIYSEAFPPPKIDPPVTSVNGETGDVKITLTGLGAGTAATATLSTSMTDTTVGHVLKVGDFGVGGQTYGILADNVNVRDRAAYGVNFSRVMNPPDVPSLNAYYNLIMLPETLGGAFSALALPENNSPVYRLFGSGSEGTITQAKIYDELNKPNAVDVGALPISGGELTGPLTVASTVSVVADQIYVREATYQDNGDIYGLEWSTDGGASPGWLSIYLSSKFSALHQGNSIKASTLSETSTLKSDDAARRVLFENTDLRIRYANQAMRSITTLTAGISRDRSADDDSDVLAAWQEYLCDLRDMTPDDLQKSPAPFPKQPAIIF